MSDGEDDVTDLGRRYDDAQSARDALLGDDWERFNDYGPQTLRDVFVLGYRHHALDDAIDHVRRRLGD